MTNIEAEVRKLTPEDGDVIVIRHPLRMRPEARQSIADSLSAMIEGLGKSLPILILEEGMSIEVLKTSRIRDREATA